MPTIQLETCIDAPQNIVFDLSRSIDLHKISTSHTREEAIAGVTRGLIDYGQTVTWRAKHFGVYQTLTSKITEYKRPQYFVDEMLSGIFKRLRHEHIFNPEGEKTIMIDVFEYVSPLGLIGKFADLIFLRGYMKLLLNRRNEVIKDYAESDKWRDILE